jgi:fibronectin-binding autotransporter adhesin
MRSFISMRTKKTLAMAILAAAPIIPGQKAMAVTRSWVASAGGFWSTPSNWSGVVAPVNGDDVFITSTSVAGKDVTYDVAALTLNSLQVNGGNLVTSGANSVTQSANALTATMEQIGIGGATGLGSNASYNQSGGTNTIAGSGTMILGVNATGRGNYNLSGGQLTFIGGAQLFVGNSGIGAVNQTGGGASINSNVFLGFNAGSGGRYGLSGAASTVTIGALNIGQGGAGTFDQSDGVVTVTQNSGNGLQGLTVGVNAGATGTYLLSGNGQLNVNGGTFGLALVLGYNGAGTFLQSGGVVNLNAANNQHLVLGYNANSTGFYQLSGTGVLNSGSGSFIVGNLGAGTFVQTGGTNTVQDGMTLAANTNSTGVYSLGGGLLDVTALSIASGGAATFNCSGGTLLAHGDVYVGQSGTGVFNQSGGHVTSTSSTNSFGNLNLGGVFGGAPGTYNLSGGSLTVPSEYIGTTSNGSTPAATGTFVHTGGENDTGNIELVHGTYTLNGASATLNLLGNSGGGRLDVGGGNPGDAGTFLHNAGVVNIGTTNILGQTSSGAISVGNFGLGSGYYRLAAGGTLNVYGSASTIGTGTGTVGTFEQTGGVANFQGLVIVGGLGGTGTYLFNGGQLTANPTVLLDPTSGAAIPLDGLQVRENGALVVGPASGTFHGKLSLLGGSVSGNLRTDGTFLYQSGTFTGQLDSTGTTILSGTTFTPGLPVINEEQGTLHGTGTIAGGGLINRGVVNVTGGSLAINSVSNAAAGAINVNGTGASFIPGFVDNFGRINLAGGRLSGAGSIGNNASGVTGGGMISGGGTIAMAVNQNGGTIRADSPATPLVITAPITISDPTSQMQVAANSVLSLQSPLNNSARIALEGAGARLIGATITNTGTISGAGQIANQVVNSGVVRPEGGDLTITEPNWANLAAGRIQVGANAVRFTQGMQTNNGTISLAGGAFDNGGGSLSNAGTIIGRGTIAAGTLNNGGTIVFSGGASDVTAPVVNTNRIKVLGGGAVATFYNTVNTSIGTFDVSLGSTAVFLGAVTGVGHMTGAGVKDFEAAATTGAITTVTGTTVVGVDGVLTADTIRDGTLALTGRANINLNGSSAATSRVNTLLIDGTPDHWNGRLNLADNDLVIDYAAGDPSPLATIQNQIKSGYANGAWTGPGISSTAAAAPTSHAKALGFGEAAQLGVSSFSGQSVDGTSVVVRYTLAGDANLDGTVDLTDFTFLAANFNGTNKTWLRSDFNYDGNVDLTDFTFLASNFNQTQLIADGDFSLRSSLGSSVPEPTIIPGLVVCASMLSHARRRRGVVR